MTRVTGCRLAVGGLLARPREAAGLRHADVAKCIARSPTIVFRVGAGERPVSNDEVDAILAAIGTEEAEALRTAGGREWVRLPRRSLDHPDEGVRCRAENVRGALIAKRRDLSLPITGGFESEQNAIAASHDSAGGRRRWGGGSLCRRRDRCATLCGATGLAVSEKV